MNNLDYIRNLRSSRMLTNHEIAELSGYSLGSVKAWFSDKGSDRHRPVPDRAVTIIQLKLNGRYAVPEEAEVTKTTSI